MTAAPRPLIRMAEELEKRAANHGYASAAYPDTVEAQAAQARLLRAADALIEAALKEQHGDNPGEIEGCPSPLCQALAAYRAAEKEVQGHD